jgi:toluene monooxygenase system protein E
MSPQRTYWHLQSRERVPSEYEIATTRLLYYTKQGFELPTPIAAWYERYQRGSRLRGTWQTFADPRATTYTSYVARQNEREAFADQIARSIEETGYDRELDSRWLDLLGTVLPVLRFPCHGLHLIASYVGQLAPEGRLVVTCAFQAMDELRRIERLAQRTRQLMEVRPGLGDAARLAWQRDAAWQPLRRLVERLLVTYDFGEALIKGLLVLKPAFDALFMRGFARLAADRGDRLLFELFSSLDQDSRWHEAWADASVDAALVEEAHNAEPIREWIAAAWPDIRLALAAAIEPWGVDAARAAALLGDVEAACTARWVALGVMPDGG